jgi:hypothetical protein
VTAGGGGASNQRRWTGSISAAPGQRQLGYDGASNMLGEFNDLQKKILEENPYAFYVFNVPCPSKLLLNVFFS